MGKKRIFRILLTIIDYLLKYLMGKWCSLEDLDSFVAVILKFLSVKFAG